MAVPNLRPDPVDLFPPVTQVASTSRVLTYPLLFAFFRSSNAAWRSVSALADVLSDKEC